VASLPALRHWILLVSEFQTNLREFSTFHAGDILFAVDEICNRYNVNVFGGKPFKVKLLFKYIQ
jgi:hypothetical protein